MGGSGAAACWELSRMLSLFLTRQYLKARMADDGKPSSTRLDVRNGRVKFSSRGCNSKQSMAPGRISIRADIPRRRVVLLSLLSKYLKPTCRNQKVSLAARGNLMQELIHSVNKIIPTLIFGHVTVRGSCIVGGFQCQLTCRASCRVGDQKDS
jgi:hypothetical protein